MSKLPERFRGMIPATCARRGCEGPSAFRVEVLIPDAAGKYGVMVIGIAVCRDHSLDVQLEGGAPFIAHPKQRELAALVNKYQGVGAPVWDQVSVRLVPLIGEDKTDALG